MSLPLIIGHANLTLLVAYVFVASLTVVGLVVFVNWITAICRRMKEERDINRGGL